MNAAINKSMGINPKQIVNKKEYAYWKRKVKLLNPKKGDILIVPAEAGFDFNTLSKALKHTSILYALVVPYANAGLMEKKEAIRFAKEILKEYEKDEKN
jgi:hypothetical protein